jgi:hypothetical protein
MDTLEYGCKLVHKRWLRRAGSEMGLGKYKKDNLETPLSSIVGPTVSSLMSLLLRLSFHFNHKSLILTSLDMIMSTSFLFHPMI